MRRMLADTGKDPALLKSVTCSIHGVVDIHTGTVFSSGLGGWNDSSAGKRCCQPNCSACRSTAATRSGR